MHRRIAVRRGNFHGRVGLAGRGAADEQWHRKPLARHLFGHMHHFIQGRGNQSTQTNHICFMINCSLDDFFSRNSGDFFYFTTKGENVYSSIEYPDNAYIIFGREDKGLPETLLYHNREKCVRIPMRPELRSLNLSNSVAIAAYEILRQWDFPDLSRKGKLTQFNW